MEEIIKCINLQNGELFAELDERRIKLCNCNAKVEIKNHYATVPILVERCTIFGVSFKYYILWQ